jgi:signal transduction histidine kinase/ligand-binding sensor domain-containing protein/DNA-binding response OmpR family regulator
MIRNTILWLFLIFFSLKLTGQDHPVKYLDISNGLSHNSASAIYQDKSGYMWFGTNDGLNRYDGYEFKIFRNEIGNEQSLASDFIFCLEGDSKNNIWIGGVNGGNIYKSSTHTFTRLTLSGSGKPIKNGVNEIKFVHDKLILAGCDKSGLVTFKDDTGAGTQVPLLVNHKRVTAYDVTAIEPVAGKGYCWVFIKGYGLYRYWVHRGDLEEVNSEKKQVNAICSDKRGSVWIGTDDGFYKFNTQKLTYGANMLPYKSIVTSIVDDHKNDIYIATDGSGVFLMDESLVPRKLEYSGKYPIVKNDAVWGLYEDRDGNKWFCTCRGGISVLGNSQRYFKHVTIAGDSSSANYTQSFCEDANKNIWIGTGGAGIRVWDRNENTFTKITKTEGLGSNFIPSVICDYTNSIWVATWYGGINKINPVTREVKKYSLFNPATKREDKNVWFIYEDRDKNLWAASAREGILYCYNRQRDKFEAYNQHVSELLCMHESHDGTLWAGNYSELYAINKKTNTVTTKKIGYAVRCILEDKDASLWIGTSEGGLLKYNTKNGTFKRFTTKDGLPGNTVLRLLQDGHGNIWLSTYNGISRLDVRKGTFRNFSVSDGLQSKQFSYNAGLVLSSGEFLFGGVNGFNVFYPDNIKETNQDADLLLADILVNNSSVADKQKYFDAGKGSLNTLSLPFDQTTISLDFLALDYENSDDINYAYYLEGWDEHWNYTGKNRKANYSKLSEGTYTFKVKSTDSSGKWGREAALIKVHVLPPWYRTWWAYILYTAVAAGIIYAYQRYNRHKERMRYEVKLAHMEGMKEKELIEKQVSMFTYISHEFRTPLSLIINPLKQVIKQQHENGATTPELAVAHRNARRLLRLIDQLLLFRRAESDADELVLSAINMNVLCDEVFKCFLQQAKEQNITYTFNVPELEAQVIGDFDKIEISIYNLISNAFKYTPEGGAITVSLTEDQAGVNVSIADNGVGIDKGDIHHIFEKFRQVNLKNSPGKGFGIGLFVVKHFIDKHKGTITCESQSGRGTTFVMSLRKGYDHFDDLPITTVSAKMSELVKELLGENLQEQEITELSAAPVVAESYHLSEELVSDKKSILIIDDNAEIRNYLISLFAADYIVYSGDNGTDGLALVKKHFPDIVLSDIAMEGMNGLELCKKIKETEGISHIPVILITATTSQETHLQGISDGADDYMTKPFDNEILKAKVETLLRNRNQLRNYFLDNITLREHNQKVPAEYRDFLKNCIEVIEANLNNENFTIKQFSQAMGMSHNGLYTKIKAISGQTLNGFIRSVKLRRAAVLMLTEDVQISQAASQVGFEDKKHFREQFVKLFGMTPSEYIKKYRHSFNKELSIIQK